MNEDRRTALHMSGEEFRIVGHSLIDSIADHLDALARSPVTAGSAPSAVRKALGEGPMPENGTDPKLIFRDLMPLLLEHSLFTAHPRFWGYITGSAAPAGVLSDLLGSSINPNVGAWILSPAASEIELQAVRWVAELIGFPAASGGVMVSGGNMANFVCFLAARRAKADWDIRAEGMGKSGSGMTVYVSSETHTWIQKAADLFGLGLNAIRWIPTDDKLRMNVEALRSAVKKDRQEGLKPFLVVGGAGTVGTGSVDALPEISAFCKDLGLWFHVDGAYGAPAVVSKSAPRDLAGLREADSLALDPHKWLYAPMEAGLALVREPQWLVNAFSFRPEYYRFDGKEGEVHTNMFEYGMQNSRGFRALKVWVQLKQAGRKGITEAIEGDISLAQEMGSALEKTAELEVWTKNLSIVTFRYVPFDLGPHAEPHQKYLNELNEAILARIQREGVIFISNAVIRGTFVLRACIVNFRTTQKDVLMVPDVVTSVGRELDALMRKERS